MPQLAFTFEQLWKSYPRDVDLCVNPDTSKPEFENQCAMKVGYALEKASGQPLKFPGAKCWFTPREIQNRMPLRAQELAKWLKTRPFSGFPKHTDVTGADYQEKIKGKTGIIFFKDYWLRDGEKIPTGDHIDLWNKKQLTESFATFLRFGLGISSASAFSISDLGKSKQILLWEIP